MDVIAAGMATTSIFSSTSWNAASLFLIAAAVVLIGTAVALMARRRWLVESEAEPEAEAV